MPDQGPVRHAELVRLPLMSTGTRPWGPSSLDTGLGQLCRVREGRDAEGSLMGQTKPASCVEAWGAHPHPDPCPGWRWGPWVTASGLGLPVFCLLPAPGPLEEGPGPKSRTTHRGPRVMAFTSYL